MGQQSRPERRLLLQALVGTEDQEVGQALLVDRQAALFDVSRACVENRVF